MHPLGYKMSLLEQMKRSWHRLTVGSLAIGLVVVGLNSSPANAQSFQTIASGDLIASLANGQVNEYSPTGSLIQTLIPHANIPAGSAFDSAGNLYVTEFGANDILKVDAHTGAVSVFSNDSILGDGTTFNSPESIAFGTGYTKIYVSDANRNGPGGGIHVLDTDNGKGIGLYPLPTSSGSEGVGESDWLALNSSGSLFMTNEDPSQGIMQVNETTGDIQQPSFVSDLPDTGYAMSFDLSGNLWLSDTSRILEYSPAGSLLKTITNPSFGTVFSAVFNPPYNAVYAGDLSTGNIFSYDLGGNLTGTFNTGSGVDGLSVAGTVLPGAGASTEFPCPAVAPALLPPTSSSPEPGQLPGTYIPQTAPTRVDGKTFAPLLTRGNQIVDTNGNKIRLASVNWYGAESVDFVPMGFDKQPVNVIAQSIAKMGFNAVRLPWSNELVECNPSVIPSLVAANPQFYYHPAMDVFDGVVNALANAGLMVILDNHMTDAGWCCSVSDHNDLWWSSVENHSDFLSGEAHWQTDWATMVNRYGSQPAVIGADLRNEPRAAAYWGGTTSGSPNRTVVDSSQISPNNGPSTCPVQNSNLACDWRAAAQTEGDSVLGLKNTLLIFVEGTSYATDLTGAYSSSVTLSQSSKLVYSPHVYANSGYCNANSSSQCPGGTVWESGTNGSPPPCKVTNGIPFPCTPFTSFDFLANWKNVGQGLDSQWGYLAESGDSSGNVTPIFLGEFGTNAWNSPGNPVKIVPNSDQNRWFIAVTSYLQGRRPFGWSYWALNGTQSDGQPFDRYRAFGHQEIYGVLDTSWATNNSSLLTLLKSVNH